jgi:hypothetical protein
MSLRLSRVSYNLTTILTTILTTFLTPRFSITAADRNNQMLKVDRCLRPLWRSHSSVRRFLAIQTAGPQTPRILPSIGPSRPRRVGKRFDRTARCSGAMLSRMLFTEGASAASVEWDQFPAHFQGSPRARRLLPTGASEETCLPWRRKRRQWR